MDWLISSSCHVEYRHPTPPANVSCLSFSLLTAKRIKSWANAACRLPCAIAYNQYTFNEGDISPGFEGIGAMSTFPLTAEPSPICAQDAKPNQLTIIATSPRAKACPAWTDS